MCGSLHRFLDAAIVHGAASHRHSAHQLRHLEHHAEPDAQYDGWTKFRTAQTAGNWPSVCAFDRVSWVWSLERNWVVALQGLDSRRIPLLHGSLSHHMQTMDWLFSNTILHHRENQTHLNIDLKSGRAGIKYFCRALFIKAYSMTYSNQDSKRRCLNQNQTPKIWDYASQPLRYQRIKRIAIKY